MTRGFRWAGGHASLLVCCLTTASAVCAVIAAWAPAAWAQASGEVRTSSITLPVGVRERDVAVAASSSLVLESGARINGGVVVGMGPNGTVIPEDTSVRQVMSAGPVVIGGSVTGDVRTESGITLRNQGNIAGGPVESTPLGRRNATIAQMVIPPSSAKGPVLLRGESRALVPGRYASLTLRTGAEMIFGAGDYFFDGPVIVEPGALLMIEDEAGPVRLGVLGSVIYRGEIATRSSRHPDLTLVGLGTAQLLIEGLFQGTVVAPTGEVVVGNAGTIHRGAFFGDRVLVRSQVQVAFTPSDAFGPGRSPLLPNPASVTPIPGADTGILNQGPALDLGDPIVDENGDPAFDGVEYPTDTSGRAPPAFCDSDDNPSAPSTRPRSARAVGSTPTARTESPARWSAHRRPAPASNGVVGVRSRAAKARARRSGSAMTGSSSVRIRAPSGRSRRSRLRRTSRPSPRYRPG